MSFVGIANIFVTSTRTPHQRKHRTRIPSPHRRARHTRPQQHTINTSPTSRRQPHTLTSRHRHTHTRRDSNNLIHAPNPAHHAAIHRTTRLRNRRCIIQRIRQGASRPSRATSHSHAQPHTTTSTPTISTIHHTSRAQRSHRIPHRRRHQHNNTPRRNTIHTRPTRHHIHNPIPQQRRLNNNTPTHPRPIHHTQHNKHTRPPRRRSQSHIHTYPATNQ